MSIASVSVIFSVQFPILYFILDNTHCLVQDIVNFFQSSLASARVPVKIMVRAHTINSNYGSSIKYSQITQTLCILVPNSLVYYD